MTLYLVEIDTSDEPIDPTEQLFSLLKDNQYAVTEVTEVSDDGFGRLVRQVD